MLLVGTETRGCEVGDGHANGPGPSHGDVPGYGDSDGPGDGDGDGDGDGPGHGLGHIVCWGYVTDDPTVPYYGECEPP